MSESFTKRKKKRSFLQKVKKDGKRGNFGKGRQLSEEEYHYYIRVFEQLKHVEKEEKSMLIKNFLNEMQRENNVKFLATSQIVSRILDDTLPLAQPKDILPIINVFSEDLRVFCVDPFASHVLQTLLNLSLKYIQETVVKQSDKESEEPANEKILSSDDIELFKSFIIKTSKFTYNNLDEFVCDTYASHVLRTVLEICFGVEVSSSVKCSRKAQTMHSVRDDPKQVMNIPNELKTLSHEIVSRLAQLSNFLDVIYSDCGSAVLQTALLALSASGDKEKLSFLVMHILNYGFAKIDNSECDIHPLFEDNSTSRLMEAIISAADAKQQELIFTTYFQEKMSPLVQHRLANFSVQRLVSSWKLKDSFSEVFESVSECLKDAMSVGNSGVLLAVVQACRRLCTAQARCMKGLMTLLECFDSEVSQLKISQLLIYFLPLKNYEAKKEASQLPPISLHGTLILQDFLNYNKPFKIVQSLLDMPTSDLVKMACDPRGSHVTDAFANSAFVGEAKKEKFVSKFEGYMAQLACNKHGSRSLESLWNSVGIKLRKKICMELFESSSKLREDHHGSIIYNKYQVRFFNKNERKDWEEIQQKEYKKRKLLKQFLEETEGTSSSPKKQKKK